MRLAGAAVAIPVTGTHLRATLMVEAPFRAGIGASLSRGETPAWRRRKKMTPVRLPPGRARVETKPRLTGSSATRKTGAERAAAQFELGQQNYDRQAELFEKHRASELHTFARNLETARQSLTGARAEERRARLAYTSNVGGVNTTVTRLTAELADCAIRSRSDRDAGATERYCGPGAAAAGDGLRQHGREGSGPRGGVPGELPPAVKTDL